MSGNSIRSFREVLQSQFPQTYGKLSRYRNDLKLWQISSKFITTYGTSVRRGPFRGMKYIPRATGSALTPKLLGSYEAELHNIWDYVFEVGYNNIIDIGCAEGYYAVGLALSLPNVKVFAFDTDPLAQQLCRDMSRINGVTERISIAGTCTPERLESLVLQRSLILCDCEGYELDLLPPLASKLETCDLLVELHDFINPMISQTLLSCFAPTHEIELVSSNERDPALFPELKIFPSLEQKLAVAEFRPETMQWAFMKSKVALYA